MFLLIISSTCYLSFLRDVFNTVTDWQFVNIMSQLTMGCQIAIGLNYSEYYFYPASGIDESIAKMQTLCPIKKIFPFTVL